MADLADVVRSKKAASRPEARVSPPPLYASERETSGRTPDAGPNRNNQFGRGTGVAWRLNRERLALSRWGDYEPA